MSIESAIVVRFQRSPGRAADSTGEGIYAAAGRDGFRALLCGRAVLRAVFRGQGYCVLFGINRAVVRSSEIAVKISLSDVTGWPATQTLPDPLCL